MNVYFVKNLNIYHKNYTIHFFKVVLLLIWFILLL